MISFIVEQMRIGYDRGKLQTKLNLTAKPKYTNL